MVVLSASVCTSSGKALVSRQFVEMNRLRVEGLLAAFPKLVGHSKQHTFVETDSVRYVYQPLENQMYLLLITTKASNIVEDLGTLRLLAKVVPDVAGGLQESSINDHAFDLIFAFDEVLTAGGYKEEATLSSIRTNLLMDSHEEKVHLALKQSKEDAAKDEMRRQAKNIKERQLQQLRQNFVSGQGLGGGPIGGMQGFGGGGDPNQGSMFQGFGNDNSSNQYEQQFQAPAPSVPVHQPPKVVAKGMKLGGMGAAGKKDSLMAAMAMEDNLLPASKGGDAFGLGSFGLGGAPAPAPVIPSTPLTLVLEEKISVAMNREGSIESCEVKGTLTLTANTEAGTAAVVVVNKPVISKVSGFTFATHPKVDKKMYEKDGVLTLKGGKGFPTGRGVGILRWSYASDDAAPITVNCWPENEGNGTMNVNVEYELTRSDMTLIDVNILLPLGTSDPPAIEACDGDYKHDPVAGMMCWHFDKIDASNSSGALEFSIAGNNPDVFFPVRIMFKSEKLLCPIEVTGVTSSANGTSIPNMLLKSFSPESYTCA
ncbi:coatomer subunit alpha [Fragilaria crotonensis]|nr:coatomer subunit alpha [Fragilaria crotonensis]